MKLKTITCSGANEFIDTRELFALHNEFPQMEFGVQVSGKKCSRNTPRYEWLLALVKKVKESKIELPLALHLNQDWVIGFTKGELPMELEELLSYYHCSGVPVFGRVQLNFKIGREPEPSISTVEAMMQRYCYHRFILSHNSSNAEFIDELYSRSHVMFDCLYDESFGEGVVPATRQRPAYSDILQGYAGGLSPENIQDELAKIAQELPTKASIFIDAEGKLKGDDGHLSTDKCRAFATAALAWFAKNP